MELNYHFDATVVSGQMLDTHAQFRFYRS